MEKLAVPGKKLEDAGNGIAVGLSDAGNIMDNVPGVGDALASPFERAAAHSPSPRGANSGTPWSSWRS